VQREINRFVVIIAVLSLLTGTFTFLLWKLYLEKRHPDYLNVPGMMINVISLIVAYVPEGMPLAITLTLRNVAVRMKSKNLLVSSPPSRPSDARPSSSATRRAPSRSTA